MGYLLNINNDYADFARRVGSKDKKKRALQTAATVGAGLAIAGGARYGLGLLGKKVKAQSLLAGSNPVTQKALSAGKPRALPATSSYKPVPATPSRARRTNQTTTAPSNGVFVTQPKNKTSVTVDPRKTTQQSNNVIRERKPPTPDRTAPKRRKGNK